MKKYKNFVLAFTIVSFLLVLFFNGLTQVEAKTEIVINGQTRPVSEPPLSDAYFIAMAVFFVLIIYEFIRIIILASKLNGEGKDGYINYSFIPVAISTLLPNTIFKAILAAEIIAFGILFLIKNFLKRKYKKMIKY